MIQTDHSPRKVVLWLQMQQQASGERKKRRKETTHHFVSNIWNWTLFNHGRKDEKTESDYLLTPTSGSSTPKSLHKVLANSSGSLSKLFRSCKRPSQATCKYKSTQNVTETTTYSHPQELILDEGVINSEIKLKNKRKQNSSASRHSSLLSKSLMDKRKREGKQGKA